MLAPEQLLRVPFAITADGASLELDLKESAEGGHGPHGLVIGAVGSGKSELLRTLVSGLAATHGPTTSSSPSPTSRAGSRSASCRRYRTAAG